jgi:hypothetical protein
MRELAGCVNNWTRRDEEWRKVLIGALLKVSREIYLRRDPAQMYINGQIISSSRGTGRCE